MFIVVSIYYGFHGPMRCAIYVAYYFKAKWHSLRYPLAPFFRAPAGPSAGDPIGRLLPHISLSLYPVPARDRIGLIKAWQGVSALLPYWAEMGPGNSHYYYR